MRAAIYARVSSKQQKDKHTIASQLTACPAFARARGWDVVGEPYVDDGKSAGAGAAKLDARAAYQRLIVDAARGAFEVVVVIDLDRLTRTDDLRERGEILGLFQRHNVRIAEASTGLVHDLGTSVGDLLVTFRAWVASEERRKIVERTKRGHDRAIADGRLPRGVAPYGLHFDVTTGAWSVVETEAAIVREIFERVAGGESGRSVARDLAGRGVPSPRGGKWAAALWHLLKRTAYYGRWIADKGTGRAVDVPALVDRDLWQAAQEGLAKNLRGARAERAGTHERLCAGLLTCGVCGARVWTHVESRALRGGRVDGYYQCSRRRFPVAGQECDLPMRQTREIDERVWSAVTKLLSQPREALLTRLAGRRGAAAVEDAAWAADLAEWERRLERLVAVELGLTARYAEGVLSEQALDEQLRRLTAQRRTLEEQVKAARAARASIGAAAGSLGAAVAVLDQTRASLPATTIAERRKLLRAIAPGPLVLRADGRVAFQVQPLGAVARPCESAASSPENATVSQGRKAPSFRVVV